MRKNVIAICDRDERYVYRLQEVLGSRESFPFQVSVFTDPDAFKESFGKGAYSLVLAGEGFYDPSERGMVYLKEKGDEGKAEHSILKYQSGESIRREIMGVYEQIYKKVETVSGGGKSTELIGIFSPVCREIQTSFSILMGQFLAKDHKVLYLNFEPFSGLSGMAGKEGESDLMDLVYYLESGKERLLYKLESMVNSVNGLDYVAPVFSMPDLSQVSGENWLQLIRTLKETGSYDLVLLDLSEMVQGLLDVLRECDRIFTIANREGMGLFRMEQYTEMLQHLDYGDVEAHTVRCDLPHFKALPDSIEELPYSELARYVRRVVDGMETGEKREEAVS